MSVKAKTIYSDIYKNNISKQNKGFQELSDILKRPNLRACGGEERTKIRSNDTVNLFNEIIAESF